MKPRARLRSLTSLAAALVVAGLVAGGAGCAGNPGPAPEPHRPTPPDEEPVAEAPADCGPIGAQPEPMPYAERSIDEAENLAESGLARMEKARDRGQSLEVRENAIAEAVDHFLTALLADPYNVQATYELAAAYAHIGRRQCALNFLARLKPLGELRSFREEVDEVVDRLLGRNRHQGRMDPAFFELRDDPGFRELVRSF
jgi:tetratricopeptide (TPR) repeat protein